LEQFCCFAYVALFEIALPIAQFSQARYQVRNQLGWDFAEVAQNTDREVKPKIETLYQPFCFFGQLIPPPENFERAVQERPIRSLLESLPAFRRKRFLQVVEVVGAI
jgi:hypothetical protein